VSKVLQSDETSVQFSVHLSTCYILNFVASSHFSLWCHIGVWSYLPQINLEKVQERWWEAVLSDEPKISVRKIDPSRPITDLDDEAQAKIEELMYNEHQKRLGLPQSHEKVCTALGL